MVTISPTENSDVTFFNKNTFDVADALLDVNPETFTGGGASDFLVHDVKKNKVIRNKINLTNFMRDIIKK